MSQLDAIVLSNAVKERLVNFALDSHFMQDTQLMQACRELWSGAPEMGGLLSDLWIEGAFPAKASGDALHDLVQQKKFHAGLCHHLDRKDVIPRHRPLYLHQRDAIIQAQETYPAHAKPALIVTAGTGAGKTESFLLPILNDLFNTSTQEEGVKCIILYPMNALVNDQVDRLYTWLEGQQRVTIFHFTGETPEDKTRANKDNIPTWDACRMRTRQEARGLETHAGKRIDLNTSSRGPVPDIIVTNYSMLEYMLCRPQDAIFFGKALRAIVLDEAHLYTGTLAAEITLLLRRLLERCGRSSEQILHIATSATIGGDTPGELESFAAKLFTKPQSLIQVIRGQSARIPLPNIAPPKGIPSYTEIVGCEWLARPTIERDTELTVDAQYCRMLSEHLSLLVDEEIVLKEQHQAEDKPAILLRKVLGHAPLLHRIESILWQKQHLSLRDLTRQLWGVTDEEAMRATTIVLQMGASARSNVSDYPLLPNRIHMLARPTAGLVVCLNKDCTGKSTLKLANLGCIAEGLQDHCVYCQSATLSLYRCGNCGTWVMAGMYDATSTHLKPVPSAKLQTDIQYLTASPLPEFEEQIALDIVTGQCDGKGTNERTFYSIKEQRCPHCDNDNDEDWQPFAQYSSLTLSILTESVLAELPEYPAPYNLWLPARGRRMLVFSDSRQAAARLGPRLTRQHEIQLVRAAMVQCLRETPITDDAVLLDFQEDVDRLKNRLNRSTLTAPQRLQTERQLAEAQQKLTNAQVGDSLEHWIDAVVKVSILQELIDGETASNHDVDLWSKNMQAEWLTNAQYIHQKLKFLLAREFARPTQRQTSLETIGLAEITYPGLDQLTIPDLLAGTLPTTHAREQLRTCWTAFLAALCDTLRTDGAITLGSTGEDKEYTFSNLLGRWCIEGKEQARWVVSFTGETSRHRRRKFTTAVLQKCGLSTNEGDQYVTALLSAAFGQLKTNAGKALKWLETQPQQVNGRPVEAIRLRFPALGLRRPANLYRCPITTHIWSREVLGCAPEVGCINLVQVNEERLDQDPRVMRQRQEFASSHVFQIGLWAEEHSAQLAPKENHRLQDLFKAGIRNILSSTTTMELGIDIGGLNAVLMSNVPPGKANYLQRAGRAGRRADGSSIVATFCHPQPFDREVFLHFSEYLGRSLRSPKIFLERKRIVSRHGHAFLLGNFFRDIYPADIHVGAMKAFGDMGQFCGIALPPYWERVLAKPAIQPYSQDWPQPIDKLWWNPGNHEPGLEGHFLNYLEWIRDWGEAEVRPAMERLFHDTGARVYLDDWTGFITTIIDDFAAAIHSWRSEFDEMFLTWHLIEEHNTSNARSQANALRYQMAALYEITVIEALADRQFMPRYGFPIGMQRLRVIIPDQKHPGKYREEDQYRLERSGLIAMGEYVPGSQLLVGGKQVTSHGLLKHWTGADINNYLGLRGQYTQCVNKHFYYKISGELGSCLICGGEQESHTKKFLLPMHGFSSAAWDPPTISTDVERVGHTESATITFVQREGADIAEQTNFAGIAGLNALYRESGELLVYNEGDDSKGFALCLKCGYAESEKKYGEGSKDLPLSFLRHAPLTSVYNHKFCWGKEEKAAPALRNHTLAARQTTDALLLDFSDCLQSYAKNDALLWTLALALKISGAKLLELDSRELGILVIPAGDRGKGLGTVLYDNVPGGAGHVQELLNMGREWLQETYATIFVDDIHDKTCETACLDCLLTFDAQEPMRRGLLNRRLAIQVLDALLNDNDLPSMKQHTIFPVPTHLVDETMIENASYKEVRKTPEERSQRGQQRMAKRQRRV